VESGPDQLVRISLPVTTSLHQGLVIPAGGHAPDKVKQRVVDMAVADQDGTVAGQDIMAV
jgi:hypothetical protein